MHDYYKVLGVARTASDEEVKKAYRRLAHQFHPDKKGGSAEQFKKINEAYQVLSSKEKRAQYDRFGRVFEGVPSGGAHGGQGFPFGFDFNFDPSQMEDMGNLGDIFDSFFEGLGVKRKRRTYKRGADLEVTQEVSLEEAFRGVTKPIRFKTLVGCAACGGAGHFPKEGFTPCAACNGRGEIKESRSTFFGNFEQVKMCSRCLGTGQIPNKLCGTCTGTGRVRDERIVEIRVAPGIEDGQIIQVPKAGEVGERGADAGDLYVRVRIPEHPVFRREGVTLAVRQDVSLVELLIRRSVQVSTISGGSVKVDIPAGFRFGDRLMISGEGMPHIGSHRRGDFVVDLDVRFPKKLSEKAKKLLEELKKEIE